MSPTLLQPVEVGPLDLSAYEAWVPGPALRAATALAGRLARRMRGQVLWSVNSTGKGGGVAEMLRPLLGYARGAGIDARWMVISGSPGFFVATKQLHNALHGGDLEGGGLDRSARELYLETTLRNAMELAALARPGDVVLLHDPQTAGMVPYLSRLGLPVIWRCHIGHDRWDAGVEAAWEFLAPLVAEADALVFTRAGYVPPQLQGGPVVIAPPTIDPFSAKNQPMRERQIEAILHHAGLIEASAPEGEAFFLRHDGTTAMVERSADVLRLGPAPGPAVPLVVQVSRWDRLKDPVGVLEGFARAKRLLSETGAELVLAGPNVNAVADDPEGQEVFGEVVAAWRTLPHHQRRRVALANLPMADVEENAAIVNALQRHASVVVQKSLHEGFGLTVTEAMWKGRPIVASRVGGIPDQIEDGVSGLLLDDPSDLGAFATALEFLFEDPERAARLGRRAQQDARAHGLGIQGLLRFGYLVEQLLDARTLSPAARADLHEAVARALLAHRTGADEAGGRGDRFERDPMPSPTPPTLEELQ